MKGIYIAALAVLLCCHVLLVQSSESQRGARQGNKKGNKSAKKEKPFAGMDKKTVDLIAQKVEEAMRNGQSGSHTDVATPFWGHDSADASQEVPAHATHSTDVEPIVMSALFDDQTSAGDISATTQTPLLKPGKGKGGKTKGGKKKGKNSKPVNANEKEGEKSKNKEKPGARKPNKNNRKPGKGKTS